MTGRRKEIVSWARVDVSVVLAAFFHDQAWEYWLKSSDAQTAGGEAAAVGII